MQFYLVLKKTLNRQDLCKYSYVDEASSPRAYINQMTTNFPLESLYCGWLF